MIERTHLTRPVTREGTESERPKGTAAPSPAAPAKEIEALPLKKLPTERIRFTAQMDIVRAYAVVSQNGAKAVNYKDVAKSVRMEPSTVSLLSGFLIENGFIERVGNDALPARPVIDFGLAHTWDAATASRKLAPLIRQTWFGQKLTVLLGFQPMSEDEAIKELGHEISAPPKYKSRISLLLDYAEAAGVIRREGNQLFLGDMAHASSDTAASNGEKMAAPSEQKSPPEASAGARAPGVATGFMSSEGAIHLNIAIKVNMAEMGNWPADRVAAFFSGLAAVVAAKKSVEEV